MFADDIAMVIQGVPEVTPSLKRYKWRYENSIAMEGVYLENNTCIILILIYTASKFVILDDFCVIKKIFTRSFDPFPNNQPFIKIRKIQHVVYARLPYSYVCVLRRCAHCERCAFGKRIGRKCAPHALQLKTR